jgi:curved DNA-binding protein CbpA
LGHLDPYEVLGVPVHADANAIAAAYRALARRHHPDVSRAPDAERRMAEINAAWAILREPGRRAAYDRSRLKHPETRHHAAPAGAAAGGTRAPGGGAHGAHHAPAGVHPAARGIPEWRRGVDGEGAAGPPPGPRSGTVLPFGRHIGWSIGEVARADPGYLQWLSERREGAPYREEIARTLAPMLRRADHRLPEAAQIKRRRLPFR